MNRAIVAALLNAAVLFPAHAEMSAETARAASMLISALAGEARSGVAAISRRQTVGFMTDLASTSGGVVWT